jgi:DNA polymerase-1
MLQEIRDGADPHADTCINLMELPLTKENRTTAKGFNFRMIYAVPKSAAYAFYMDPSQPNFSQKKWDKIVTDFFTKYKGLDDWHKANYDLVCKQGFYTGPTGRIWKFHKEKMKGGYEAYSVAKTRNYQIQGTAGDIIKIAMVVANKRRLKAGLLKSLPLIPVHDSYVWDSPEDEVEPLAKIIIDTFREIPELTYKYFGFRINCPINGEAEVGKVSWGDMIKLEV